MSRWPLWIFALIYAALIYMTVNAENDWRTALIIGGTVVAVAILFRPLVRLLQPWWRFQDRLPAPLRGLLALALPMLVGWLLGRRAAGTEWGSTLVSMSAGVAIAFLLLFSPLRPRRSRSRA